MALNRSVSPRSALRQPVSSALSVMRPVEDFVEMQFQHIGFRVERVPRTDAKTPDLRVWDGKDVFLVEVKTKVESSEEALARRRTFQAKDVHYIEKKLTRKNRISGILKKAATQLQNAPPDALRIVWIQAAGINEEPVFEQVLHGLYGLAELVEVNVDDHVSMPCYFFGNSDFYLGRKRIDGAIVGKSDSGRLCINPYSNRSETLRASRLAQVMRSGITDPIEEEASGAAYIADCDISRDDVSAVLKYVQQKYGTSYLSVWQQHYFGAWIEVPHDT